MADSENAERAGATDNVPTPDSAPVSSPPSPKPVSPKKQSNVEQQDFVNPTLNIIQSLSRKTSTSALSTHTLSREGTPPPLPPRPRNLSLLDSRPSTSHSVAPSRPQLVSKATTQLSYTNTQTHSSELRDSSPSSSGASRARNFFGLNVRSYNSDVDDGASVRSFAPTIEVGGGGAGDTESSLAGIIGDQEKTVLRSLGHKIDEQDADELFPPDPEFESAFEREFDEIEDMAPDGSNEEKIMHQWRAKLKHFLILSSAGKPIYSRHGDDQLVTNYIGVIQTIISFYQSHDDTLKGFTAGDVRFVISTKGPLNLVAISRLPSESDAQLRSQLDALYMQILSTLTLPSMQRMFAARANYDLRRPLEGTESLLSALSDGFTRGSPSTLLSALECLKLRKTQRNAINKVLLSSRSENLLYGLIVAGGKLVSVVRPKKHSLHPGDLHLIFNMLFEAGGVKAGGGENWIPLCLPGFNNTGYLYMYVSFLNLDDPTAERPRSHEGDDRGDEVAILLISANKEGFFELRGMRDSLVEQLQKSGSISHIQKAVRQGRPQTTDIVPGSPLRHFLYKSRGNVQFVMPSFEPTFASALDRRRLMNHYNHLHSSLHSKPTSLKIYHQSSGDLISLAWSTPLFELYAVAPARTTSRAALAAGANEIVRWVRREEERVFIIGGAVF